MAQRNRRDTPPRSRDPHPPRGTDGKHPADSGFERRSPAQLAAVRERVQDIIEPVLAGAGYDLEDLAIRQTGRRHQLRIAVDGDGGVSLDVIADLSRAIADALDAAEASGQEVVPGEYQLEVSSPGVDRPLTQPRHWRRAVGRLVSVKVHGGMVTGRLTAADATGVTLEIAEKKAVRAQSYPLAELGPGHVQIEFNRLDDVSDDDLVAFDDTDTEPHDGDFEDEGADDEDVEEQ
jgi:ribosome maturation factor RimP